MVLYGRSNLSTPLMFYFFEYIFIYNFNFKVTNNYPTPSDSNSIYKFGNLDGLAFMYVIAIARFTFKNVLTTRLLTKKWYGRDVRAITTRCWVAYSFSTKVAVILACYILFFTSYFFKGVEIVLGLWASWLFHFYLIYRYLLIFEKKIVKTFFF